jgi:Phosphomannomutase
MGKYFGTDGIRGKNERFNEDFIKNVCTSLSKFLLEKLDKPKVLIGGDTRSSTKYIKDEIIKNLNGYGIDVIDADIIPTPAISYLTSYFNVDSSIMITASHNPPTDNGIKLLNNLGEKIDEETTDIIEEYMDENVTLELDKKGFLFDKAKEANDAYLNHLISNIPNDLKNLKIGLDCANGATSKLAMKVFEKLGANVKVIHNDSNYGTKINDNCGSTHIDKMSNFVLENNLDLGAAFDGDGDRCLFIDNEGNEVDGDQVIAIVSLNLKNKGELNLNKAVTTVMANQGLMNFAKKYDIDLITTNVGDSYVAAAMKAEKLKVGGEQSGHIILPNQKTGDGLLTALTICSIMNEEKKSLKDLASIMSRCPQVIVNINADDIDKSNFKTNENIKEIINKYDKSLENENGRMLIRPSGTEPLIRVTMWGEDKEKIKSLSNDVSNEIKEMLDSIRK